MERQKRRFSRGALAAAATMAVIVLFPLLAILAFAMRFVLVGGLIVAAFLGALAYALSPAFREWLGFQLDPGLTYSGLRLDTEVAMDSTHGWVRFGSGQATVGADDMVQQLLGPVEIVELPEPGRQISRGEPLFRLTHGDRDVAIPSPVSGKVVETNRLLAHSPRLVNEAPFDRGWIARIDCDDARNDRRLMVRGARARQWFRREVDRLLTTLEPGVEAPVLPDGGHLVWDLHRQIDDETWKRVRDDFFTAHDRWAA